MKTYFLPANRHLQKRQNAVSPFLEQNRGNTHWVFPALAPNLRHSREGGNPVGALRRKEHFWIPAFAGMTGLEKGLAKPAPFLEKEPEKPSGCFHGFVPKKAKSRFAFFAVALPAKSRFLLLDVAFPAKSRFLLFAVHCIVGVAYGVLVLAALELLRCLFNP
jgi:hypothetical protein